MSAGAQSGSDEGNAATWYQRAIERYNALPQEQRDIIGNYDLSVAPSPGVRAVLADANVRAVLEDFRRGAAQPVCDFGLDRSQGFALLLPHLAPLRGMARLTRADFGAALADGDSEAITRNLQSLYLSSGQVGQDDILISTLVGTAIFSMTDGMTQAALDAAALSPEVSAAVVTAMESLDADDPFHYTESIIGERELGLATIQQYRDSENPEEVAQFLGMWAGDLPDFPADDAAMNEAVEQYDAFMTRAIDIFSMDDPAAAQAAMHELEAPADAGELGPLTMMLAPGMGKALEVRHRAEGMLASRVTQLKQIASGQAKPEDFANAAVWYRRAMALIESLEPPRRAALCACAAEPGAPLDPQTIESIERPPMQRAIELLQQGSMLKRCQFLSATDVWPHCSLIPDHMPGMHEAMCLLLADSLRLQAEGDAVAACDRLAVCTRVAAHLLAEPHLTGSLIAHTAMSRIARIVAGVFAAGSIEQESITQLEDALQRHDPADTFGYTAATRAAREFHVTAYIGRFNVPDPDQRKQREADAKLINRLSADELLYCMAFQWEVGRRRSAEMEAEHERRRQAAAAAATQPAATQPAATQPGAAQPAPVAPPPIPMPLDPCLCLSDVFTTGALLIVRQEVAASISPPPAPWQVLTRRSEALPRIAGPEGFDGRVLAAQDIRSRLERLLRDAQHAHAQDR